MTECHDETLSEYQRFRVKNIERNNARLRSLGLISAAEEKISNAAAWGKVIIDQNQVESKLLDAKKGENYDDRLLLSSKNSTGRKQLTNEMKKRAASVSHEVPRKSLRLQGASIEGEKFKFFGPINEHSIKEEREERVRECREARIRVAKEVADAGVEAAAKQNPTATYEHCLMRVKTMTEKGLSNRVSLRVSS